MKFWDYKNIDKDKIGNISQLGGLRHYEFVDGKAKGIEAVEVNTGAGLSFTVLPGRGMDIAWTQYRGVPLNYMSKTGVVAPEHYDAEGMSWLYNFFAGTLTTCGLMNVGGPEKATHPVIGERSYGLHGRITNCAAEQVSLYEDFEDGEYVMRVSGLMSEAILHGEHLTLRREISTKLSSKEFTIKDTVCNRSSEPISPMILYHINAGYPLLDEKSRFLASSKEIIPQSEDAKNEIDKVFECHAPIDKIGERCYCHIFNTDDSKVKVAVVNDELELGLAIIYDNRNLPYFNQWKMLSKKEYVMGLEPCNAMPMGRAKAEKEGILTPLAPDESRVFEITLKVLDGKDEIAAFEAELL